MLDAAVRTPDTCDEADAVHAPNAPRARPIPVLPVLEAQLLDAHTAQFGEVTVKTRGCPSFGMARKLIDLGFDPEARIRFTWANTGTQSLKTTTLRVLEVARFLATAFRFR